MIKKIVNDVQLSRLSYLLEIIEVRDFRSKLKAYNKISKMKITKEMGLLILNEFDFKKHSVHSDFDISFSLLSLLFNNYYEDYGSIIKIIYKDLTLDTKFELLSLMSNSFDKNIIILYKDLVLKYGKELDNIPIGKLSTNKDNYNLLFPDFFKVLKFNIKRNNILVLLNNFILAGVVKEIDIRKNKKLLLNEEIKILKEAVNYKFKKDEIIMKDTNYINLRIYLEAVINMEFYVSNKETKKYLERLFKKKDNQIKLFILENYIRKGIDISKFSFQSIAKDNLSRYPLYSFLMFYNLEKLMPKKYSNNILLAESDMYLSFCSDFLYGYFPENINFLEERTVGDFKYYIFSFETNYNYYEEIKDVGTDYILKTTSLDKTLSENVKTKYIGISGGYNKELNPSLIEKNIDSIKFIKYDKDKEFLINELLPKYEIKPHIEVIKKKRKNEKKKLLFNKKKNEKIVKIKEKKVKKKKKIKLQNDDLTIEEIRPSLLRRIFSFNSLLILVCIIIGGSAFILFSYISGGDILNLKVNSIDTENLIITKSIAINNDKYKEINYKNIFNQGENEYYVLLYKKKKKSVYHNYIKTLLDNKYILYYVDISKDENMKIFESNSTGFTIKDDTLLKVNNKEYEFYVVGKTNILKELRGYIDEINKTKAKIKEEETKKSN